MSRNSFDLIIDVRTKEEYDLGHAKGTINIPLDEVEIGFSKTEFARMDKSKKILLVCRSGARAEFVKDILEKKGFTGVENGGSWMDYR